ncbi:hypothetical protein HGRIS_002985 [Hohenbuehelia grisea]|uniref:Uncharacterized protein n=1 Tax=Hohenbuehelia grisea TaxID=104357 RepID=A0ABR3JMB4_9AGAR
MSANALGELYDIPPLPEGTSDDYIREENTRLRHIIELTLNEIERRRNLWRQMKPDGNGGKDIHSVSANKPVSITSTDNEPSEAGNGSQRAGVNASTRQEKSSVTPLHRRSPRIKTLNDLKQQGN